MAITIDNTPTGLEFSHRLGVVTITTDGAGPVRVSLMAGSVSVFVETLYPYDGRIEIPDVAEAVEEYMRMSGRTYTRFTLIAATETESARVNILVLYCDSRVTADSAPDYTARHCLSTDDTHRIPRGYSPTVAWYGSTADGQTVSVHVSGYDLTAGRPVNCVHNIIGLTPVSGAATLTRLDWPTLAASLTHTAAEDDSHQVEVQAFSFNVRGRWHTYYVDPTLHVCTEFVYRNAFNVFESLTVPTQTTVKSEVRSTCAVLNDGRKITVDNRPELTHETDFGPLTLGETRRVHQLARSAEAYIRSADGTLQPIVMTGGTCEYGDRQTEPVNVKLEWEYSHRRLSLPMPAGLNAFAEQYNPVFA